MPHNGFIYEARMDMMENSGHWVRDLLTFMLLLWFKSTKMKVRPYFTMQKVQKLPKTP